jgi:hypothetical protein
MVIAFILTIVILAIVFNVWKYRRDLIIGAYVYIIARIIGGKRNG